MGSLSANSSTVKSPMVVWKVANLDIVSDGLAIKNNDDRAKNASVDPCRRRKKGKTKNCVPVADRYHILYMFYTIMFENNAKLPFRNFPCFLLIEGNSRL